MASKKIHPPQKQSNLYHSSISSLAELGFMKQYDSKTQRRSLYQTQQELSSRSSESRIQVRDHICKVDTEIEPPLDKTPVGISDDGSSIELLAHVQKIKTLLRHKLDLLDNSNKSLDSTSSDMCHQAIMNADTNLLTSCPSHRQCFLSTASSSQDVKRCAAITEFLCDVEKCRCCQELITLKGSNSQDGLAVKSALGSLCIQRTNQRLVTGGAVAITGGDKEIVVSVFTLTFDWSEVQNIVEELSFLLQYIIQFHRHEKITVIVDARRSSRSLLRQLMESLHDTQRCSGNGIDVARVLIDRPSQTGTIVKSVRRSTALPVDILTSTKCLQNYTSQKHLPRQFGGEQAFNASRYISFHQELSTQVSHYSESLDAILTASHTLSRVPQSLRQCSQLITIHNQTLDTLQHTTTSHQHNSCPSTSVIKKSESCHILPTPKPRSVTPHVTSHIITTGATKESYDTVTDDTYAAELTVTNSAYSSTPHLSGFSTLPSPRKLSSSSRYSMNSHQVSRSQYSSDTLPKNFSHGLSSDRYKRAPLNQSLSCPVPAARPNLADQLAHYPETRKILEDLDTFTKGTEIYRSVMDNLNTLSILATDVARLKTLAEERLKKLYGLEKVWFYIEEMTKTLNVLKRAHEVINKHRGVSCNLKAAKYQLKSFNKLQPKIENLLSQADVLLSEVTGSLLESHTKISWLQQLSTKLSTEILFITSLFEKTKHLVNSTHQCYIRLDQVYDWALDAMKLMSQESMDNYMTPDALELLASGLKSFMDQKSFIDDAAFDEISKEARFLSNRKLAEQCKMAKRRCHETKHLLDARWTIVKQKREDILQTPPENTSKVEQTGDDKTSNEGDDIHSWQPNFTRSAPPTPALALRCSSNLETKRRSQSLEDELANQVLQYIESEQACDDNHQHHDIELQTLAEESNACTKLANEVAETCSITDENTPVSLTPDQIDKISLENSPSSDNLSYVKESIADDTNGANTQHDHCNHTVYRGDKFLDADNDITIPLDEDFHINNNFLVIASPIIENKGIIYTPPHKPEPAQRPSLLSQTPSNQASAESLLEKSDSYKDLALSAENHKVTFIDGAEIVSPLTSPEIGIIPITVVTENTLGEPHQPRNSQCKLSPVLTPKQKQKAMQKRRSFHGFTSAITTPIINFAKSWKNAEDNVKRLSVGSNVSENDEVLVDKTTPIPLSLELSPVESIEESADRLQQIETVFKERENSRIFKNKRLEKTLSLVTGSSESLPSLPEDDTVESNSLTLPRQKRASTSKAWSPIPVNSHLMNKRVLPTHRSSSMADLRLTESEIKSRITLAHIMDELIQTERDYVVSLGLVVDRYIPEMCREDVPQTLRGKRGVIFGNVEKIHEFHSRYFLQEMVKCENEPFKISQCFLKYEAEFLMYALYNKNKPKSDFLMSEYGSEFFREQQDLMGDKMNLSSYLLKPVQRMGKYALILKQVLKECPESSPEYQDLVSAEEMIRFCLQHGNDLLAMDALEDCDVNLQEQGTLLLQDEFTVWKNKRRFIRHVFLFEHLLVFSKTKLIGAGQDQYTYKNSVKTADLGLTENVGTSGLKFEVWFRKRTGESWTFQATSLQAKNRWVNVVEKLLWTQALKNRESRLTELSTMGVGHKPSLDLKKSADNINDRFIPSINKSSNIAGNRHSLDSLDNSDSFDTIIKKRPYSVISLANSSSSSGSSSGSMGPGNQRSLPWADLKAAVTGKGMSTSRSIRIRKLYKSDSRINSRSDDSGISSDLITTYLSSPRASTAELRKGSETEV